MLSNLFMHGTKVLSQNSLIIFFQYADNVHNYNTRYGAKQNLHKFRVKTNTGKQMISFMTIDLWHELPYKFKDLNQFAFSKSVKNFYSISAISNLSFHKSKVLKLSIIQVISNVSLPQFF